MLIEFVEKETGLTLEEKLGCVLGDPFLGRRSTVRRDSLLRLLMSQSMATRGELLDMLRSPRSIRQAILISEVLSRPDFDRD